MIFPSSLLLFSLIFIHANEQYHLGIINHRIQWHMHCPGQNTRIINPPLNDQPLISYQCPSGSSLPIEIVPSEIELTLICRSESQLIWLIVDLYQYTDSSWSTNIEQLNIGIELNNELHLNDSKRETNKYQNRFITINAFYIPFESLENLLSKTIEIFIRVNQCRFYVQENFTWNEIIERKCHSTPSQTLQVQQAQCDFFPKLLLPIIDHSQDTTTTIPDYHVILSIDEQQQAIETTTVGHSSDYYLFFNEHYQNILSTLAVLIRASNLLTYIFIFTLIIFIVLIIFFLYTLCYHYHSRSKQKASLLI